MTTAVVDANLFLRMLLPSQLDARALVGVCRTEPAQWGAWAVARRFGRPTTYDSEFYALAEQLGAELWTADDRFVNAMGRRRPPWVRRLSDVEAEPS